MSVCACLAWYDEPPESLEACVRSLAGVADCLLALDGPWQGHPFEAVESPDEQFEAIERAARDCLIALCVPLVGPQPWESQVAKRAALMQHGARINPGGWLLVIDADETVEQAAPDLRDQLAAVPADQLAATVAIEQERSPWTRGGIAPRERLFRARPDLTVERCHNGYRAGGRWLAGDRMFIDVAEPFDLTGALRIRHHQGADRSGARLAARLAYRQHRRKHRLEQWRGAPA